MSLANDHAQAWVTALTSDTAAAVGMYADDLVYDDHADSDHMIDTAITNKSKAIILDPANADGSHKLDKNSLHIWPRGEYMLMALANTDGTFTCTLFMPHEGENSFAQLKDQETLESFFAEHFPDTAEVIPDLVEDFFKNPTSFLVTMKC